MARLVVLLALTLWSVLACLPPQASYKVGVGTTEVRGSVNLANSALPSPKAFALVYQHHHSFISLQGQPTITRPTAHLVNLDDTGAYRIAMPADVVSMDIFFIAPNHLTDVFQFKRQLGVGDITYQASLQPMSDWRDHFFTFLKPQLEHLITEKRYRLENRHQQQLSDWILQQEQQMKLAIGKTKSG